MTRYIIKMRLPVHDLKNLCEYGQNLLESSSGEAYDAYDTWEDAKNGGGRRMCTFCQRQKVKQNKTTTRKSL